MKGRKLSAFAALHGNSVVARSEKKNKNSPVNGSVQKKRRRTSTNLTKKNIDVKETRSCVTLKKPPIISSTRSISYPNVTAKKEEKLPIKCAAPSGSTVPYDTPKAVPKKKKDQRCSIVTSPARSSQQPSKIFQLSECDNKELKAVKSNSSPHLMNSTSEASKCFQWLIHPVPMNKFFNEMWEKKPLLVKRHHPSYFNGIFSCGDMDGILREKILYFTKNIDITTYINGKRETHNPDGRAYASVVWDYFKNGCSVRFLNPQTFSRTVWRLNSILQEYFGSCVGANVYLTPAGSQGFAPHYDDIEAFVLQLEGRKRWKLYNPRSVSETLPRFSSENFTAADLDEPILNIELEPGDLLYFPRGIIHQASTPDDTYSLHITVSTFQRNTWSDFLEKLIPRALQLAYEEDLDFRQSLPCNYLNHVGVAHSDKETPERKEFMTKLNGLLEKLMAFAPVDACADQMAKHYIHDCLPPLLNKDERMRSIHTTSECWQDGKVIDGPKVDLETRVRLLRGNILRLVTEEDSIRIYHSVDNSREYHGEDLQFLEIAPEFAPAVEYFLHSYPDFVAVKDLPLEDDEEKVTLGNALFDKGLLLTEEPYARTAL